MPWSTLQNWSVIINSIVELEGGTILELMR